jgi:hypothetical protein
VAGTQPGAAEAAAAAAAGGAAPSANRVALAKELTNPISDLIRVPVQFNYDEGFGPAGAGRYSVSVQPVFPIRLSEDLTLITRTNVPLVYREAPVATGEDVFGLGDISQSLFFCPQGRRWIWGIGPLFVFPTASDELLAGKKWGAGPNVIGVVLDGHWTYGAVVGHLWSFAGSDSRPDVSVTSLSTFLAYTTTNAYTLALQTDSFYDWKDDHWTIPIELQASKVTRFGRNLISVGVGGRYYIDSPENGPEWFCFAKNSSAAALVWSSVCSFNC